MRLNQLEALVILAEEGSLRAAARRLGVSQPALTKSIRALETELGVALVQRTPKGVTLNEFGRIVYGRARGVGLEVQRLRDEVAGLRGDSVGHIRVAVSPVAGTVLLPRALDRFRRDFPHVTVHVEERLYPEVVADLRNGTIDLALGPQPPSDVVAADLALEPLFANELVIATARDNPYSCARSIEDLHDATWLVHGPLTGPGSLFQAVFASLQLAAPDVAVQCTSFTTSLALLRSSAFVSVLPRLFVSAPDLVALAIEQKLPVWDVCLLYRSSVPLTRTAQTFVEALRRAPIG